MPDLSASITDDFVSTSVNDDVLISFLVGGLPSVITSGSGVVWNRVQTAPVLLVGNGYIIDVAVNTPVDLPEIAAVNDFVIVYSKGLGQIIIRQRVGEQIRGMGEGTTTGVAGSCVIYDPGGWVFLLYQGGGIWEVIGGFGGNLILN